MILCIKFNTKYADCCFGGKIMKKRNNKSKNIRMTEEMIPVVVGNEELKTIKVNVDGYNASCFLHDRIFYSTKIVILFDELHPYWGEYFTTKSFKFEEPGKMNWGHDNQIMEINLIL